MPTQTVTVYEVIPPRPGQRMPGVAQKYKREGAARSIKDIQHEASENKIASDSDLVIECGDETLAYKRAEEERWRTGVKHRPANGTPDHLAPARAVPTGPVNAAGGASFTF